MIGVVARFIAGHIDSAKSGRRGPTVRSAAHLL
jgi:hypothetical protein